MPKANTFFCKRRNKSRYTCLCLSTNNQRKTSSQHRHACSSLQIQILWSRKRHPEGGPKKILKNLIYPGGICFLIGLFLFKIVLGNFIGSEKFGIVWICHRWVWEGRNQSGDGSVIFPCTHGCASLARQASTSWGAIHFLFLLSALILRSSYLFILRFFLRKRGLVCA